MIDREHRIWCIIDSFRYAADVDEHDDIAFGINRGAYLLDRLGGNIESDADGHALRFALSYAARNACDRFHEDYSRVRIRRGFRARTEIVAFRCAVAVLQAAWDRYKLADARTFAPFQERLPQYGSGGRCPDLR